MNEQQMTSGTMATPRDGPLEEPQEESPPIDSQSSRRDRLIYTAFVMVVCMEVGCMYTMISTAFLDLLHQTETGIEDGALLFTLAPLGYMAGSLLGGPLYDTFNTDLIYGTSIAVGGVCTILVPWPKLFPLVVCLAVVYNMCQGSVDTGSPFICAVIWGDSANPFQQGLVFVWALGGMLAPFLTEPVLDHSEHSGNTIKHEWASFNVSTHLANESQFPYSTDTRLNLFDGMSSSDINYTNHKATGDRERTEDFLYFPFLIIGLLSLTSSVPFFIKFYRVVSAKTAPHFRTLADESMDGPTMATSSTTTSATSAITPTTITTKTPPKKSTHAAATTSTVTARSELLATTKATMATQAAHTTHITTRACGQNIELRGSKPAHMFRKAYVLALILITGFFLAQGFYWSFADFTMPYLVSHLGWSKTEGARLISGIWGAYAACAFVCIFVTRFVGSCKMLILDFACISLGLLELIFFANLKESVWVSYLLVFSGLGSLYSSAVCWVDQHLLRISGKLCCVFIVTIGVAMFCNSLLLGHLFARNLPQWNTYIVSICTSIQWVIFLMMSLLSRTRPFIRSQTPTTV